MNWIKEMLSKLFAGLIVKAKKQVEKKVEPEKVESKECGCNMKSIRLLPPYTDKELQALGNTAECPVPFPGKDLRLMVLKPDGSTWLIGMLFAQGAVTFNGNTYTCHCFGADGGRYHYLGHCKGDHAKDIIPQAAGVANEYTGTEFVAFELRAK